MLKRILFECWRLSLSRLRAIKIFLLALYCKAYFYPFSTVSVSGKILIGSRATVKKTVLNAGSGVIDIGASVWVNSGVEISAFNKVSLGVGSTVQRNVTINGDVSIGRECLFAPNVFVSSSTHIFDLYPGVNIREQERRVSREEFQRLYNKPIEIGDDVWLGANAVIMPGVKISSHAIVGANSVVTADVPVGGIVAGAPAKIIKFRPGFEEVLSV